MQREQHEIRIGENVLMARSTAQEQIGRSVRAALSDLAQWDLGEAGWVKVERVLVEMDDAVAGGEPGALSDALDELDLLSPVRAVGRLGKLRAPRTVQLVANRLVHRLGERAADPALGMPFLVGTLPPHAVPVADQELVVHRIAAADGDHAGQAYQQLRRSWLRCRRRFAMTRAINALGLPTELPDSLLKLPVSSPIAAVTAQGDRAQALLWREHDVIVLSVLLGQPVGRLEEGRENWVEQDTAWDLATVGDSDHLIGSVRLYLGVAPADDAEPGFSRDPEHTVRVAGYDITDLTQQGDPQAERRLIVLADPSAPDGLGDWAWSQGPHSNMTRYLVNAAKLRYEARVRRAVGESIDAVDEPVGNLTRLITDLGDMSTTARVARRNMTKLLGLVPHGGFAVDDHDIGDWLMDQLDADTAYLQHERTRRSIPPVTRGQLHTAGSPTLAIVTAMAEERTAALLVLDDPEPDWVDGDPADYTVGTLPSADPAEPHRVVLCQLGGTATASAAESVAHLIRSYPSVDQIVMTGIAAGFPVPADPARHVRLGDILVATYGVVAYDHIVDRDTGSELRAGFPRPSVLLSRRVERLRGGVLLGERPWEALIEQVGRAAPGFARPDDASDMLYDGDSDTLVAHPEPAQSGHFAGQPKIHYGRIGSADRSLRHAVNRDELARRFGIIGVEMEGAGVGTAAFATGRSWFVVKGVSDYADRHMNQAWRNYAALAASAYVRSLLAVCPVIAPHVVVARPR